jgi:prepilin-type processing-associated H-X9-DG protein
VKISSVKRTAMCAAFSEANLWTIGNSPYGNDRQPPSHPPRTGDGNKTYSSSVLGNTDLDLSAKAMAISEGRDNIATYHKVGTAKCDYGVANILYVDGHVGARKGLAGYDAYFEYGRPYDGHEKIATW